MVKTGIISNSLHGNMFGIEIFIKCIKLRDNLSNEVHFKSK